MDYSLSKQISGDDALAAFDRLVVTALPFGLLGVVLCAIHPGEVPSLGNPAISAGITLLFAVNALFRRQFPRSLHLGLYCFVSGLAATVSLFSSGVFGLGLLFTSATLLVSSLGEKKLMRTTYACMAVVMVSAACLHCWGSIRKGAGARSIYDQAPLVWFFAMTLVGMFGVWAVMWRKTNERLLEAAKDRSIAELRFRSLFAKHRDAMVIFQNGRITDINPRAEKLFGYARSTLLNLDADELRTHEINANDTLPSMKGIFDAARGGNPQHFTAVLRKRDGMLMDADIFIYLSVYGGSNAVVAIIRDVSREHIYQRENHRLAIAVEQAGEAVAITGVEGNLQYVNHAFEMITGYSRDEVLGKNPRILQSGKHDSAFYKRLWDTILEGKTWRGRLINRRKNGTLYTEEASITPIRDDSGRVSHYVAVKRDISRELEMENQLGHANKMEAVGRLAGGVAHDFNNILQVINGNLEMAFLDIQETHPAYMNLKELSHAAERATALVRQLLAFSRKTSLQLKPEETNKLISGMIKMIRRLIGEDISLSFNEAPETLPINADAGQIEQVLLNLCVNARDAMPEGGRITIETERAELDAGYCELHPEAKPGRYVAISVSDTGCGIAPEIRARVFEPFFTTKEVGRGTGLGLATVYAIVQRHGGCINLYSEVGIGTTFRVYLPLIEATPVSDLDGKSQGLELFRGKGETILVAEDDEQVLSITSRILNLANYRVISARDGEQVLEIYKQKAQEIRMVILDVVMPKLNGRQTYDSLKRSAPDLPIIFATGYSYHHLQDQIIEQEQILRKPFTPRELLSKVQNSLLPKARPQENHAADIQDQEVSSAL